MFTRFNQVFLDTEHARQFIMSGERDWCGILFYKIDFRACQVPWVDVNYTRTAFIACQFEWDTPLPMMMNRGAFVLNQLPDVPYDPYHIDLYTPEELMGPRNGDYSSYLDADIYAHYSRHHTHEPSLLEFFAQWMHDYAIQVALANFLRYDTPDPRKVVGIMGGHSRWRTNPEYRTVAEIARALSRKGFCIATGGGPGAMEAANLGAWLSPYPDSALDDALAILAQNPQYTDKGYLESAWKVRNLFPAGGSSLSVPTWFYGHEPTNIFATNIAKYFSNSIREDGLLAVSNYGIIYTPGRAGTVQEIFMDATQNHYGAFKYVSPMIFFGKEFFGEESGIMPVLKWLSKGLQYADMLTLTDDPEEVVRVVESYTLTTYNKALSSHAAGK